MSGKIEIVGARTNNLKSVDVTLPLGKATMMVGVSGSGKSSLLADTLATEANARMRRFLGLHQPHLGDEDVPAFVGAIPICVHFSQGAFRASRRTTVATSSGLLALLRHYFRRYSEPWAEDVKSFVPAPSHASYGHWIENHYKGSLTVWAIVARWERTDGVRAVKLLRHHGVKHATVRSETDTAARSERGRDIDLDRFRPLAGNTKHLIEAEVGRTRVPAAADELSSLLRRAFDIGCEVIVEFQEENGLPEELHDERGVLLDSTQHWVHPKVLSSFAPPSDALLSFNSPSNPRGGACPSCRGLGRMRTVDIAALVTHPERSMHDGAFSLWTEKNYRYVNIQHETIEGLRGLRGFDPDLAWKRLGEDARRLILNGSGSDAVPDIDRRTGRKVSAPRPYPGFVPTILRRLEGSGAAARALEALTTEGPCPECNGSRWSRVARALRLGRWHLPELLELPFDELEQLAKRGGKLERGLPKGARSLAGALRAASDAFVSAGLGHLSGERGMTTLSEGESRRSRLAALLRTRGEGLGLLLDEPARGLHEEDVARLAIALSDLKQRHTLIINEHRLSLASVADHVLEIGPGPGDQGGRIVNSGPPQRVFTPSWHPQFERPKMPPADSWLTIEGARIHTLSDVSCRIPLGRLVSITGVSGSGKSSFIRGILVPSLTQALPDCVEAEGFVWPDGVWESITGAEDIRSVLALEPRTPGSQRRSTVATLLGLADDLRRILGKSVEARRAGLTATDFGLNAGRGRCQTCLGLGEIRDDDRYVPCPHCGGRRFGEEALAVRVEGLNVAEILELPISELANHKFADFCQWLPLIDQLLALDLGYLTLGRRIDRLSGGEHQRLRIARTLSGDPEGLLLVLDEPSAGLHPQDVARLLRVLDRVVAEGRNTIVLVEHNLDLIRVSDWVIDFGPGGGPAGGRIIGQGSPHEIAKRETPTGRALRKKKFRPATRRTKASGLDAKKSGSVYSADAARSGRQWLKRLLGEEASAEELDPVDFEGLAVTFDPGEAASRPHEIAGLDVEIARLLLDEPDDMSEQLNGLADLWSEDPKAQLRIHPLIEELRVWRDKLPLSVLRATQKRLKHMGLESDLDIKKQSEPAAIRATGKRFHPVADTLAERVRCIRDAIGIGGGYVELWKADRGVIDTIKRRHLALEVPAVAPHSPTSACLVRSHSSGRCPCCEGLGSVPIFDQDLVIANPSSDPTSEKFLYPEAFKVLPGVRKSLLLPFLKRMVVEGLWPAGCAFARLKPGERTILMHGYWCRPGPGSFLKTPRADPEEVGSWLRWNGLFRAVLDEADRSKSSEWKNQITATTSRIECPDCAGTGLQSQSRAIILGDRSFFDWIRKGTVGGLVQALRKFSPASVRSQRMVDRVLYCLEPLSHAIPSASLREPIEDGKLLRAVFERTVHSLTRLEVIG